MDTSPLPHHADGPPLARCSSWVWQRPGGQGRGCSNATMLVCPGLVMIEPRTLPRWLGKVPAVRYEQPTVVLRRLVWSQRLDFPGTPAVLLDIDGRLGSAQVSFGWRDGVAATLHEAGFEVVEDVVRGFEAPHSLLLREHRELEGRLPKAVLRWARSTYPMEGTGRMTSCRPRPALAAV